MTAAAMSLAPDPSAAQQARRFVSAALQDSASAEAREVAELLVSELVTNAVVHAASPVEVEIDHDDTGVLVRVRDADTGPLVMRAGGGSELDEGGRGFLLVDRLAEAWGTEHRGGRKTVWFRVRADGASEPPVESSAPEIVGATTVAASEQRLRTLLLRPSLSRAMTFDQHVTEL